MINIVIPMAGLGKRFSNKENYTPKAFVDVGGKPMFIRVIENFQHPKVRFIILARTEDLQLEIDMVEEVKKKYNIEIISIDILTEGTVCTVLHARSLINNGIPLLIVMADQLINFSFKKYLKACYQDNSDGNLVCFTKKEPDIHLSYVKVNEAGYVSLVKEKKVISNTATAGIYYFKKGEDFVNGAIDMIINNDRVNNEFYVAPVYNYLISQNLKIGTYKINSDQLIDLGTEEKLEAFNKYLLSKATKRNGKLIIEPYQKWKQG